MNLTYNNKRVSRFFSSFRVVEALYIAVFLIIPLQKYFTDHYNNFKIFKYSTIHFFTGSNLHAAYPKEYYDFFLYSPSFPVLFAPVACLPILAGMFLWMAIILLAFYFSIKKLPFSNNQKIFIFWFTLLEVVTSVGNLQTNLLVTAFILFTYIFIEKEDSIKSGLFPVLGFFIKGYGIVSGALFIARRSKFKYYLWAFVWGFILLCLPLIHYSPSGLINLYSQWAGSLFREHSTNMGISVMGMISSIFGIKASLYLIQVTGLAILVASILYTFIKKNYDEVKALLLSSIMIFIIIFNHDAESATYIIASTGVAIWYISSPRTWLDKTLAILTFVLTVFSPSDLFPAYLRRTFITPFCLKALGPSLVWIRIQYLIFFAPSKGKLI
jgi:hypothetical protein